MSHAYAANFIHIVFSTKDRRDLIPKALEEKLWAYLFGIAKNLGVKILVGGTPNHVHLLICLPPALPLAEIVKKLKANSSRWLGEHGLSFEWQKGYGAFSVSSSMLEAVKVYIRNQPEHHRKRISKEEFAILLRKSGIVLNVTSAVA